MLICYFLSKGGMTWMGLEATLGEERRREATIGKSPGTIPGHFLDYVVADCGQRPEVYSSETLAKVVTPVNPSGFGGHDNACAHPTGLHG